ncbi:MAG TPA: alkylhydroperoxidase, partial [Methylomirabilota bacterium]
MADNATPISRFPVPDPETLPEDIRKVVEANAAKAGFTPNVFLAYGYKPEHFRAFFHYYDVLMKGPSELSRAEREMI